MKKLTLLMVGVLVLTAAWFSRLPELLPGSFSRHMAVHMTVVAVAAPLLSLGLSATRLDPVRRRPRWFPPVPISVLELVVVWAWHAPAWHHFARHSTLGLFLEQGSFLVCGVLVWLSAFGGAPERNRGRMGAGVVALLLTSMHMTLLGALLALPPRALYVHPGDSLLSSLQDQHLGGAIMLVAGGAVYLLGGLSLTARLLRGRLRAETQPLGLAPANERARAP